MTAGSSQAAVSASSGALDAATRASIGSRELAQSAALALLGLVVFFFHLGSYGLFEPDEARYAEIAREMVATGHFIIPHLNYVPYIEKPPLLYWMTSLAFYLLGANEFAARLVPALSAMAGVIATWWFARRVFGHRRAMLAGAILITSPLYATMAQVLTTDMLLTTFLTVAFFSLFLQLREGGRWWIVSYLSMALAVLTKGPEGVVLPAVAAILFLQRRHELKGAFTRFHAWAGLLIVIVVSLPWFVIVAARLPGFLHFYIIGEHFKRVFVASYSHDQPFYFYLPVIIAGMLPWSICLPLLTVGTRGPARSWCGCAAVVVLVLFSIANAKLIPYILPALPLLALLLADSICCAIENGRTALVKWLGPALCIGGSGAIIFAALAPMVHNRDVALLAHVISITGVMILVGGVLSSAGLLRARFETGLTVVVIATAAALIAATYGRIDVESLHSWAPLAREVEARAPSATLIDYHRYPQAIPFYTRRRVLLVGPFLSELSFGADHIADRQRYFLLTDADLLARWRQPPSAVLIIDQSDFTRLAPQLAPARIIARQGHKLAVASVREPG
jgi:4-amino-4-deoxy-L-arabinose transferase-like glycosyltransferase